jgi:enediyne biosynthesis protein E4
MRFVRLVTGTWIAFAVVALAGCGTGESPRDAAVPNSPNGADSSSRTDAFVDAAEAAGLQFVYFNGMSGEFYFPEMIGGGVALFDYDNDGDLDVYFVQGQMLGEGRTLGQATIQPKSPLSGRLYRNELTVRQDGVRTLRFTDVTDKSRIDARGYGMGVATGDVDNDGCMDLYLTNFGSNRLFRNNCDGTFTDVSQSSGTADSGWSVAAAFLDYDRDGWLDLYVGHYVQYSISADKRCTGLTGRRDYCTPAVYTPEADRLYRNLGSGRFVDVTAKALIGGPFGPALGVSTADFNGDGWADIYVANDGRENLLWINQRDGTFRNTGLLSGAALSADGKPEASMGVDAGDFDNDGDEDLFMTHLPSEGNNLYVNDGSGLFEDRSAPSALGPLSIGYSGFGTAWFDYDNDGWLDILAVNGAIEAIKGRLNEPFPYDERNLLFRNLRDGRFEDATARAGAVFSLSEVSRGAAFGDIDNDGDVDVVLSNVHAPARLLINNVGNRNHWAGLRLIEGRDKLGPYTPGAVGAELASARRDMLGAKVEILRKSGPPLWRRVRTDGSYASANDPRVLAGLGESTESPTIRVHWPGGAVEEFPPVPIDRWTVVKQGEGGAR